MENHAISDVQIDASSEWGPAFPAFRGRLHTVDTADHEGAWNPATADANQWLQVDLGILQTNVTRVATQGRNGYNHWVTMYNLQYSDDGVNFQYYMEQGQSVKKVND